MTYLENYLSTTPKEEQLSSVIAYLASLDALSHDSPEVVQSILSELSDQRRYLKLIASENFSSLETQLAMGNLLTDKYSEGFVGKRFYAGCENVDRVEGLAEEYAKQIFEADHAYVQPHSGIDANLVAMWAILVQEIQSKEIVNLGKKTLDELTDDEYERVRQLLVNQKIMGLSLNSGGHLTHGYRHNISSKMMRSIPYDVDPKSYLIDYKEIERKAKEERPLIIVAGYSAYSRLVDFAKMREIADSVGAKLLVDMAHFAGLVAGKALTGNFNPIPFAHIVTTTTHKTLRGPRGGLVLCTNEYKDAVNKGCPIVLGGPLPHVIAAKAVAFKEAMQSSFQLYAKQIIKNAQALAAALQERGVSLLTGGTDNHMLLFDAEKSFRLTGRQAELALREAHLTVNRNAIPFDSHGPWYTSGVRIGTPAVTTLGMKEKEMEGIAEMITDLLHSAKPAMNQGKPSLAKVVIDEGALQRTKERAQDLLAKFPLYPELVVKDMAQC